LSVALSPIETTAREMPPRMSAGGMAPNHAAAPLRILHVLRAPLGGLFRHVVDLTRAQVALGHQVGLVADAVTGGAGADTTLADLAPQLALGLLRFPMRRLPHPSDVSGLAQVVRRIRQTAPDVVHGHGSKGGLYARLAGFLPIGSAAVRGYTPHGGSFNYRPGTATHRLYMTIEALLARRTDILLFESAYIAGRFDAFVGSSKALRRIVPNGIAPTEFQAVEPGSHAAEFLYVGELRSAKGIDTLLHALAQVSKTRNPRPRLVLVGSGPDTEALRQQADHLGLTKAVTFRGPMPARAAFALGRTLVVPSRAESLPYIVLEAAGARIPLVATNVGGIPEIFGPFRDRLIPCDDPAALASAMIGALDADPTQVAAASEELAKFVQGRFSFANMVTAVVEGYRAALAAKAAKGRVNPPVRVSQ